MANTIKELWYGNLAPYMSEAVERDRERALVQSLKEYCDHLDEQEKKRFRRLQNRLHDYLNDSREQAFCQGFSLGMKLAAEALLTADVAVEDMAQSL